MSKLIGSKFCHFFHTTPTQRRRRRRQINFNHLPNGGGSDGLAVIEDDVIQRQKLILSQNFGKQLIGHGLDLVQEQEVQVRKGHQLPERVGAHGILERVAAAPPVVAVPKLKLFKSSK